MQNPLPDGTTTKVRWNDRSSVNVLFFFFSRKTPVTVSTSIWGCGNKEEELNYPTETTNTTIRTHRKHRQIHGKRLWIVLCLRQLGEERDHGQSALFQCLHLNLPVSDAQQIPAQIEVVRESGRRERGINKGATINRLLNSLSLCSVLIVANGHREHGLFVVRVQQRLSTGRIEDDKVLLEELPNNFRPGSVAEE